MNTTFKITISAVDRYTKTIKGINNATSQMLRGPMQIGRSLQMMGREIGKMLPVRGIMAVGRAAKWTGEHVWSVGKKVAAVAAAGGGLLFEFAREWMNLGRTVNYAAANIGIGGARLMGLRGAARLTGIEAESLDAGLESVGKTMEDALFGRNEQAVLLMRKLNIEIHKTADGTPDAVRGLYDIADAIASMKNPYVQRLIAQQFGVEHLLPMLRKGSKGIQELEKRSPIMSQAALDRAEKFAEKFEELKLNVLEARDAIGNELIPVIRAFVVESTKWLHENTPKMAETIGKWLKEFDFKGALSEAKEFAVAVKEIVIGVRDLTKWAADKKEKYKPVVDAVSAFSPPNIIARGMEAGAKLGEAFATRGIRNNNPGNLRKWGNTPVVGGYAQFATPAEGVGAMVKQLGLYNKRGINTLGGIISTYAPSSENNTAAYIADVSKRMGNVAPNAPLDLNDPKMMSSLVNAMIMHENGRNPYGALVDQAVAQRQKVEVEVSITGAPAGTRARVLNDGRESGAKIRLNNRLAEETS